MCYKLKKTGLIKSLHLCPSLCKKHEIPVYHFVGTMGKRLTTWKKPNTGYSVQCTDIIRLWGNKGPQAVITK